MFQTEFSFSVPKAIIDEISRNTLSIGCGKNLNLEENEQKIIDDAILSENLTDQDIRGITNRCRKNQNNR